MAALADPAYSRGYYTTSQRKAIFFEEVAGCPFGSMKPDFRKFLAGAFFVSSGILFYLYLARVSVPLLGTSFVETPQISGGRSIVHFILFLLCLYFGFIWKPEASKK